MTQGAAPCVSVYMPARIAGQETRQNQIRMKNLLSEAEDRLAGGGMRAPEAAELLDRLRDRMTPGSRFWQRQASGLAAFVCPAFDRIYRLPLAVEELVVVGERFHVKPLLPLLTGDGRFYVLAVSQNEIRLLRGSRDAVEEVELEDVPSGLAEALKYDVAEKQLQHRLAASEHSGGRPAIFHGHGGAKDTSRSDLERYFQMVDGGIRRILGGERAPLILAGVDYIRSAYAQVSGYPALLDDGITGNPENASPADLHAAAWKIVQPHFDQVREEAATRYRELAPTGRASGSLEAIVPTAYHGGVETLFVNVARRRWGAYDPETNTVALHEAQQTGDEDLLDHAAVHTLLNGGEVFAGEEVPDGDAICAVFRYEVE